jgi:NDP-sugar pyrophosphorylase family protein
MPIGERPILEYVLNRIREAGITKVTISVGHLAELIQAFFGNGKKWGLEINYAIEETPLNTIGPLPFVADLGENFLVMNGDLLTDLDISRLWEEHLLSGAVLTVATFRRTVKIDFGVLRFDETSGAIHGFEEKPVLPYDVSMGIYVLNRKCLDFIPKGESFGFDQLVLGLLAAGKPIHAYVHTGKWLDIGRQDDYATANEEISEW